MFFELEGQEKERKKKSSGVGGILGLKFFHSLKQIHNNRQLISPSLLTLTEGHPSSFRNGFMVPVQSLKAENHPRTGQLTLLSSSFGIVTCSEVSGSARQNLPGSLLAPKRHTSAPCSVRHTAHNQSLLNKLRI